MMSCIAERLCARERYLIESSVPFSPRSHNCMHLWPYQKQIAIHKYCITQILYKYSKLLFNTNIVNCHTIAILLEYRYANMVFMNALIKHVWAIGTFSLEESRAFFHTRLIAPVTLIWPHRQRSLWHIVFWRPQLHSYFQLKQSRRDKARFLRKKSTAGEMAALIVRKKSRTGSRPLGRCGRILR